VLTGGSAAFQGSTFQNARLIGAKIVCGGAAFQGVNIDAAQFQGADVSAIPARNLEECYYKTPPTYDDQTRFPAGFDPVEQGWQRVPSDGSPPK
jgi:hypothetical protein